MKKTVLIILCVGALLTMGAYPIIRNVTTLRVFNAGHSTSKDIDYDWVAAQEAKVIATTEAALETQITDATNIITNNDTVAVSAGAADVGKLTALDASGKLDASVIPSGGGVTDHGGLTGLGDDDHPQYHNDARGDARYIRRTGETGPISTTAGVSGGSLSTGGNLQADGDANLGDGVFTVNAVTGDVDVAGGFKANTDTLVADEVNNRVGVGTATPEYPLQAIYDSSWGTWFERETTLTANALATTAISLKTTGQMADGFGPILGFFMEDADGVSNYLAGFGAFRSGGADNNGSFKVTTRNAGTMTDALILDETQSLQLPQYGAGTLQTDASGNVTASSDARLKSIVGDFEPGLDAVLKINPKRYYWAIKSGLDNDRIYAGLIAQDVQDAGIPEAVGTDPNGYLTLSDRPIIAALINAVQEQQGQIEELKQRIETLEAN